MLQYEQEVIGKTYCARVGYTVAKRRFKKNHPEKYRRMMQKNKIPMGIVIINMILFDTEDFFKN